MKKIACSIAIASILMGLSAPVKADLQGSLLGEYSASVQSECFTITDSNVDKLSTILAEKKGNIIAWQVSYDKYDDSWTPLLLKWVREGGSLWFYDARLAENFGMKMYELRGEQFMGQQEEGQVGDVKMRGRATTVFPLQNHAVSTGVASVAIFTPLLDKERDIYGSIMPSAGVVSLLQFATDSPALAALRREGYGTIVYKPLLWEKTLSGERFQRNIVDFCSGYGVPGVGGEGRVGEILNDRANYVEGDIAKVKGIENMPNKSEADDSQGEQNLNSSIKEARAVWDNMFEDNSSKADLDENIEKKSDRLIVAGQEPRCGIIADKINFEGGTGSYTFEPSELRSLERGMYGNLDTVILKDGTVIKGFLMNHTITVKMDKSEYTCKKNDLKKIEFSSFSER